MAVNIYETVKQAIQDVVAPGLKTIEGQIQIFRAETDGKFAELRSEIRRLDEKIDSGLSRLDEKIDSVRYDVQNLRTEFHMAIDMHERIAAIEAKLSIH